MIEKNETKETVRRRAGFLLLLVLPTTLRVLSNIMTGTVLTDLIVYQTCLVSLNNNATDCMMLRTNSGSPEAMDLEVKAEPYASMIVMATTLLQNILPGVVSTFLGPWSDRGGRRPLLLATFGGMTITYAILSFICDWEMSPWYLLFALIPTNVVGGTATAKIATLCYICDKTAEKDRMVQLTLLDASCYAGIVLGSLIGPLIYENYGYTYVFMTAAALCASSLIWISLFVSESVEDTTKKSVQGLEAISFMKQLVTKSSTKEESFRRPIIGLTIFSLTLNTLVFKGNATTAFLFTRARLGWDVRHFSYFRAANLALQIPGLCLASLRGRLPGTSDTMLIGIGSVSALGGAVMKSLTWKSWHMYLSACIEIFGGIMVPVLRSVISKFVPAQDVGKVFSLAALLETLSFSCGTPLYTFVYSRYLPPIYPSPVHLLSTGIFIILILCATCIGLLIRKSDKSLNHVAAAQEEDS